MTDTFVPALNSVPVITLREPLAQTLGALGTDGTLEYSFKDAVKMAGHACPTVSGAFLATRRALASLYEDEVPVRGDIAVTVHGGPEEGVYGVMGQVMGFITGAAQATGFDGLMTRFRRKNLLTFDPVKPDPEAMSFEFRRLDTGRTALVKYYPGRVPFPAERASRMAQLMKPVVWDAATPEERTEFGKLWMSRVEAMLIRNEDIENWLTVEVREAA